MKLALFDLDRTLLPIDGADDGSHFVVHAGGRVAVTGGGARLRAPAAARHRPAPERLDRCAFRASGMWVSL